MNIKNETHLERKSPVINLVKQLQSLWNGITFHNPIITFCGLLDFIARWLSGLSLKHFSLIFPNLYIGGQFNKRGWLRLKKRGVTAVVNMRNEYDDELLENKPNIYLHLKVIDNQAPTFLQLQAGIDFIQKEIKHGGQVYIHCAVGVGRAPTMAAAYLLSIGLSLKEVWNKIYKIRPFIHPTSGQIQQIKAFSAYLQQKHYNL